MSLGLPELIERYISPEPNSGCWLWTGALSEGYGHTKVTNNGKQLSAHTTVYRLLRGPICEGFEPDHLCRVRCCVNPDHIEPVTKKENTMRGVGVGAVNAKRTECKNGHPFDESNTRFYKNRRYCRACSNKAKRAWQKRTQPWRTK